MTGAADATRGPLVPRLATPGVRLFLTSAAILFVELLLIRWIPAEVRYVGFFSNSLLMASFLGIGLGLLLGRRGADWSLLVFPILLAGVVALVSFSRLDVEIASTDELFFGLKESAADTRYDVLILVVVLVTAVLAAIALPLGGLLKSMRPLRAYAIDITGSLAGIAAFALLSALGTDPLAWFGIVALFVALLLLGVPLRVRSLIGAVAMGGVLVLVSLSLQPSEVWSDRKSTRLNSSH